MVTRKVAADLVRQNDYASAIDIVLKLIEDARNDDELLGLLAVAFEGAGHSVEAETAFRRALENSRDEAHRMRYASNYAAFLIDQNRRNEASKFLDQNWTWSVEAGANEELLNAVLNLTKLCANLKKFDTAIAILRQVIKSEILSYQLLHLTVRLLSERGFFEEAYKAAKNAPAAIQHHSDFAALRAFVAENAKRHDEAKLAISHYIASNPVYMAPRPHRGKIQLIVINDIPSSRLMIRDSVDRHFSMNFPSQMIKYFSDQYVFDSIFAFSSPEATELLIRDRPAICLNNCTNAERLRSKARNAERQHIDLILDIEKKAGLPVINSAGKAQNCTRQINAKLIENQPGFIVPKIERYNLDKSKLIQLVSTIESKFKYPVILRGTVEQRGRNMHLCNSRLELQEALMGIGASQIYIIEFRSETRHTDVYRRIRAAFVNGEPIIMRADYSPYWMIHNRTLGVFKDNDKRAGLMRDLYRNQPKYLEDTTRLIEDPESYFGSDVMRHLSTFGQVFPLDIFGLDFDVSEDGQVIFFEANATMNLFPHYEIEMPYPSIAAERLKSALSNFLESLAQ